MFNCKMTEEPTMATAEENAQRVYAKKLAADRERQKRKRAEESQEQQENRFATDRESKNRKRLFLLTLHFKTVKNFSVKSITRK